MADSHTTRLCVQIVHSQFGPLTSKVVSALLTRGRLTLQQLGRYTLLKPRTLRASIIALVQHNIVWHTQSEDEPEMLEVNVEECLVRLRFGRFVWQAEQLFGQAASEIVQLILDHGKLRPPEIIMPLSAGVPKEMVVYKQALFKLVSSCYLKPSTILSHISPRDKRIQYEAEEKAKISGFPTAKELRQAKETAEARLKREEEEAEKVGMKRKAVEQPSNHRNSKKKAVEEEEVDDGVYFRINYAKFNVHMRNVLIERAARERYNEAAATVIRAALKATSAKQMKLDDARSDPVSIGNIAMQLPEDHGLAAGLIMSSSKKLSAVEYLKDYLGMLSAADNPTPAGRAASFVSFTSQKVQVECEIVCRRLRQRVLEAITREKHGDDAVRIIRLLLETGKMDEKQISKIVMMAPKDVRPLLSALAADTLISTQEVAKSADHNPTRTFYLWHVDLHKAYSVILGNLYKTLYNIGARRQAEQEEPGVRAVLDKAQRSDVVVNPALLSRLEQDVLKEWEAKRQKLTVLEMRVEEAVFIIRDLGVLGISDE
ncbi:hypothetical protein HGRIS_013439 [Hohenbuehelia grisea]|uniref:DNA-directed RNA polymerase III subunit RPC3 n=1 Tax=Hohenbuehelia grisea TaxID=104357 RepID=A0ABR3IVI9_9AGAR